MLRSLVENFVRAPRGGAAAAKAGSAAVVDDAGDAGTWIRVHPRAAADGGARPKKRKAPSAPAPRTSSSSSQVLGEPACGVDAAAGVAARKGERVVLNVIVVGDQMSFEILGPFDVIGVVNDGVVVELFDGATAGLLGQLLQ